MSSPIPRPSELGPEQLVTSSDLVRHFGLWQERAARMPVYVLHRGRPRFVLASIETMEALCAQHDPAAGGNLDAAALLDGVSDLVLVAGEDGRIVASSRAARAHFGELAAPGARLDAMAPNAARPFLVDAVARVAQSGIAEQLDLPSPTRARRMLATTLMPMGRGTALFAQDGTTERDHLRLLATRRATDQAMTAAGQIAVVTLSARGYIVDPSRALAALTGLTLDALAMIRFAALAEIGYRVALGDAVERVLADGDGQVLDVALLVNRAAPVPVRIGIAPIHAGLAIEGAVAAIAVRAG